MNPSQYKIYEIEKAEEKCETFRKSGKRVVFTNGCFDILHPGHTRYLHSAGKLGDHLIVGLNSDRSVKAIKGDKRPIFPQQMRAELLSALECVDGIVIFDEDNPFRIIERIRPDILVKGGDWKEDQIIGAELVKENGGMVQSTPFEKGYSTTEIIKTIILRYC